MAQNLLVTVARALAKGKLHVGTLTGLERFLLAQMALPDRVPMLLAATNVEPQLIDPKFNYQILAESTEANLELFARVKERFAFDVITSPTWLGLMVTGVAELGVQFQIEKDRVSYPAGHPIQRLPADRPGYRRVQPAFCPGRAGAHGRCAGHVRPADHHHARHG